MLKWPINPYSMVLIAAAVFCLGQAVIGWKRRKNPGAIYFVLLMSSVAWWAATAAFEYSSTGFAARLWNAKFQYLSVASLAPLWLLFALGHGQYLKKIKPLYQALLWFMPIALVVLAFTNERHGLVWPAIHPASPAPGALLVYEHGPAIWVHWTYSYLFILVGSGLLIRDALRFRGLYRRQAAWLMAGALFPWVGNFVYMLNLGPAGLDFTPLGFTAGGFCFACSLFRYKLLDVVPIAHSVLIDTISDCIIVLDEENRILELNPAARRLLGIAADFAGRSLIDFLRPWPDFAVLASGLLTETGDRLVRCPEIKRWLDVRISLLSGRHGEVSGRLIVLRDVTEIKAGEEAQAAFLERIERQRQAIVGLAFHPAISSGDLPAAAVAIVEVAARALQVERVGIWLGNSEEGRITCFDLFELSRARHSGGLVLEAAHYPSYFKAIESDRAIDAADACADSRTAEFCDGYLRPLGIASMLDAPIRASGRVQGIVCIEHVGEIRKWLPDEVRFAAEIADQAALALLNRERKRVQVDLEKREERLRILMDNMIDIISQIDARHRAVFVSPSVTRVLGYSYTDLLGKTPAEFIHPEDFPALFGAIEQAGRNGESSARLEYRFRHADGRYIWIESQAMIMVDDAGRYAGAVFSSRDISARRQAEDALRASLREKDVLLKEVHHRVRNNMQVISSLLNHQARLITDPAVLSMFQESQNRIRSIALVHEKLYRSSDLSRIDFADYIESLVVHLFHTLQADAGRITFHPALTPVEVDVTTAIPLGLIVNELVMNALEHAFPQSRRGEIVIRMEKTAEGSLRLEIADDGIGLPPDFDPARASSLGWQIVLMLVEQIGGTFAVRGEGGTTVTIVFGALGADARA